MDIQITGRSMDLGDALQSHVRDALEAGVRKYFDRSAEAVVTFGKTGARDGDPKGREFACEIVLHLASGVFLTTEGNAGDAHGAFDEAMTKLDKRVRRYKRRLKDHHAKNRDPLPAEAASAYVLRASSEEEAGQEDGDSAGHGYTNGADGDIGPLVIAEQRATLRRMTVSDAVLQLDVGQEPVVMFRNAKSGDLSVVYKRDDGNIGWIDGRS